MGVMRGIPNGFTYRAPVDQPKAPQSDSWLGRIVKRAENAIRKAGLTPDFDKAAKVRFGTPDNIKATRGLQGLEMGQAGSRPSDAELDAVLSDASQFGSKHKIS
jgi:hypothetical protein